MATDWDSKKDTQKNTSQPQQPQHDYVPQSISYPEWMNAIPRHRVPEEPPEEPQRFLDKQSQTLPIRVEPSNTQDQIISYGQQMQYERSLHDWSPQQLAEQLGVTVPTVLNWESDRVRPNLEERQRLSQVLGNAFYLSSEVLNNETLRVRIVQRLLVSQDFTFVLSSITWMYTQFWLIQQGRFADLAEYLQTEDMRFVEEANLIIDNLSSNSPALITLITDPHNIATIVTTTVTLVVALQKAIDAVSQTWNKHKSSELEHQKQQLELKRMQWEFEQEQLKKQQEMRNKDIEDALDIVKKIAEGLNPGADEQARITMNQAMLPIWEKFLALK